jgi:hypothetical protein
VLYPEKTLIDLFKFLLKTDNLAGTAFERKIIKIAREGGEKR